MLIVLRGAGAGYEAEHVARLFFPPARRWPGKSARLKTKRPTWSPPSTTRWPSLSLCAGAGGCSGI